LLGDAERVVDLDPEIAHRTLQLRMPEQQLYRSQIAGFSIDLGHLRPALRIPGEVARESGMMSPTIPI
jgi:hypothetical protein